MKEIWNRVFKAVKKYWEKECSEGRVFDLKEGLAYATIFMQSNRDCYKVWTATRAYFNAAVNFKATRESVADKVSNAFVVDVRTFNSFVGTECGCYSMWIAAVTD